ncbi:MAG: hypothetical protein Q8P68_01800 [Candidatus Peregrinibacteria bacterium]|nr:hypothetical protein [Candidatus Peregrinibacteria bacterium]MDZ4244495.1 hypothetical protein [Candidatus Gracilibacteria bacterium]
MSGSTTAHDLRVAPDVTSELDPALRGMEDVKGYDISGPSAIGSQLEELRLWLAGIGVATGAHFGVRQVDGEPRIVRLNEGNEVLGILPSDQPIAQSTTAPQLQVLEGGRGRVIALDLYR